MSERTEHLESALAKSKAIDLLAFYLKNKLTKVELHVGKENMYMSSFDDQEQELFNDFLRYRINRRQVEAHDLVAKFSNISLEDELKNEMANSEN